jgi:hypothetical protein
MAKFVCMFALVGLATSAPQASRGAVQDQEVVISQIMSSLQPAIDAAIAAALGENTVTTITVEGTYGPANVGNANVQGYFDASSVSANYESSNVEDFNAVQQQVQQQFDNTASSIAQTANYGNTFGNANYGSSQNTATKAGSTLVSTAGIDGVVYHDANQAVNNNAVSSTAVNNVNAVQQVQQQSVSSTFSLTKAEQQQQLVSAVMNALVPSVETAVQRALMAMMSSSQQQQTTSSVSTQTTTISASQEQALVTKIIEVLTPSIASSVRKALAAAAFAAQQQAEQQAAAIAAQQAADEQAALLLAQQQANFQAQQQANFQAQQQATFQAQQQTTVTDNSATLVAQIIAALKPSIAQSVSLALEESRFSSQQQSQAVQQQSVQQQSFQQSQSATSGSLSSSSLTSIFGDGKAHNVKVETPQYAFEYNN